MTDEITGMEFAGLENDGMEKQNLIRNQIPHLNFSRNQLFPTLLMRDNICNFVFIINIPTVTHKKQWTATSLTLTFFSTLLCYFSVVLYK